VFTFFITGKRNTIEKINNPTTPRSIYKKIKTDFFYPL